MRFLAFAVALLVALGAPVRAEERITSFVSDVTVNADASLDVRETITVVAQGNVIKRGILRDFPTAYRDRIGQRVVVGFAVTGVKRNGQAEPYALEALSNGTRIRIGDKDVFLDTGPHRYEITYRTTRQIGFFESHDELYWNVTGNGWTFPIERARVTIRLPQGAVIGDHAEYTGYAGARGNESRVIRASGNVYQAETTRSLAPEEGFTVAVSWQKGIIAPPSMGQRWDWWMSDNVGYFALALGLLASLGYFLLAWNKVGRDPERGTIVPLFRPPKDMGPACVRYVSRYGSDEKGFAAALVGLGVKGRLRIADDDGGFSIAKLAEPAGGPPLTTSERALYQALPAGTTELKQAKHARVGAAKRALESALKEEYDGSVFLRNFSWFAGGLALSVVFLLAGAFLLPEGEGIVGLFAIGWMGVWWGGILTAGWASLKGVRVARGLWRKISSLFALVFLIPFVGAGLIGPGLILMQGGFSPALTVLIGTAIALGFLNVLFYQLLRAPTEMGQKLLDQIEGFRLYLSTAEEERLKVLNPPDKTPELFERYLPYALALDCENEWNAKFATVLAAAAAAGAAAPPWYSGRHWDAGRSGGFTDSLGRSLAASAAAASTAPGTNSGSRGGGSSGGGGGGGGGGGW
jgi:uncharacterized membrane protein YgcG